MPQRCTWAGSDLLYVAYHDHEWGVPQRDPSRLFEMLILEGAQAGLSWITILRKRANYWRAFDAFDPQRVARFTPKRVERLMADPGIVRNRLKIEGAVRNARLFLDLAEETGDVAGWFWHFESAGKVRRCADMTLGIVGLGRIGKRMAYLSRNLFKRVVACDPYLIDGDFPAYVERASLDELFRQSDVVSLHTLLNDETRGMIGARVLGLMQPGSYLVNTSRGAVVDIDALADVLREGRLDGAGLDVLPQEPIPAGHPLATHPRVLLSPHAAFYSVEAERDLRRKSARNIVTWARTGRPDYVVVAGTQRPGETR
jgi:DNA-3-methyladenine glycosylase I